MTLVMKFGGTSVGSAGAMRQAAGLVEDALAHSPLVVLSAMSGVTDTLFEAARAAEGGDGAAARRTHKKLLDRHLATAEELFEGAVPEALAEEVRAACDDVKVLLRGVHLLHELTARSMDAIASAGERLSTQVFAAYLRQRGLDADWFDAREVLRTDRRFGAARPQPSDIAALARERLAGRFAPGRAIVTQGYVGSTEDGLTTTLGRGGSDYSAALFAAALHCNEVQIWTDVEGILTSDPRIIPQATPIAEISFAEAAELAAFGAKVLHPATIQPAVAAGIPVTVRHAGRPQGAFTTIKPHAPSSRPVTALASRGPVTVLTVGSPRMLAQSGFLARLFEIFGRHSVSVDLVATAEVSVSLTVEPQAPIELLAREIETFAEVQIARERAIVAIVGERIRATPGLARRVFSALAGINIEMISMGANEINLSLVVQQNDTVEALRALHKELFEGA
jgi:aspartate kinase